MTLAEASNFAIEELKLPVNNVLSKLNPQEFLCPGSTIHVDVNRNHPLTFEVANDLLIVFRNNLVFEVRPGPGTRTCG